MPNKILSINNLKGEKIMQRVLEFLKIALLLGIGNVFDAKDLCRIL